MTGTKMMAGMGATNMGGVMTLGEGMMMDGGTTLGKEMAGARTLGKEMTGRRTLGKEMTGGKALGKEMTALLLEFTWN